MRAPIVAIIFALLAGGGAAPFSDVLQPSTSIAQKKNPAKCFFAALFGNSADNSCENRKRVEVLNYASLTTSTSIEKRKDLERASIPEPPSLVDTFLWCKAHQENPGCKVLLAPLPGLKPFEYQPSFDLPSDYTV